MDAKGNKLKPTRNEIHYRHKIEIAGSAKQTSYTLIEGLTIVNKQVKVLITECKSLLDAYIDEHRKTGKWTDKYAEEYEDKMSQLDELAKQRKITKKALNEEFSVYVWFLNYPSK
jgi:proline dehydrogenase